MPALGPAPAHHGGGGDDNRIWPLRLRPAQHPGGPGRGRDPAARQLEALLGDTGTAENVRIDAVEQGQWLLVTLRAECLEEIGREVPLTKE